jgi:translation initiation factor IF-3
MNVLKRVKVDIESFAKVETEPRFEARQLIMILAPK